MSWPPKDFQKCSACQQPPPRPLPARGVGGLTLEAVSDPLIAAPSEDSGAPSPSWTAFLPSPKYPGPSWGLTSTLLATKQPASSWEG